MGEGESLGEGEGLGRRVARSCAEKLGVGLLGRDGWAVRNCVGQSSVSSGAVWEPGGGVGGDAEDDGVAAGGFGGLDGAELEEGGELLDEAGGVGEGAEAGGFGAGALEGGEAFFLGGGGLGEGALELGGEHEVADLDGRQCEVEGGGERGEELGDAGVEGGACGEDGVEGLLGGGGAGGACWA